LHDPVEGRLEMICKGSDVIIMIDFGKETHEPILRMTDKNMVFEPLLKRE
jgi:hypothetical protein